MVKIQNLFTKSVTSGLGVANFKTSEATNEELTPHKLMRKAKDIYERRPFIHSGINLMVSFSSGSGIYARLNSDSKNTKGLAYLDKWIEQRYQQLLQAKTMMLMNYYTQANVYLEKVFRQDGGLDNVFTVPDSSRVYYNNQMLGEDSKAFKQHFWLFRVEVEIPAIIYRGEQIAVSEFKPYKYSPSSVYWDEAIRAFTFPKRKLKHLKSPYTMDGYYGYGFLMSTIDDEEAINKIIRNIILISSNKAIGTKIIGFWDENGRLIPEQDIDDLKNKIDFDVGSNIVTNKKFQVEDLSHSGTYDTMISEVEYLTKDVGSGLVPSFMTPWNSDVNRATAEQARLPFMVRIENEKQLLEEFFSETILEELRKEKPELLDDVYIDFGETEYFSREEQKEYYIELYEKNLITYNELRSKLGMEIIEGGDRFARDIEAAFDRKYRDEGTQGYVEPGVQSFGEGVKKLEDLHDYEFDEEESDTLKVTKKQMIDMTDEIGSALSKHIK